MSHDQLVRTAVVEVAGLLAFVGLLVAAFRCWRSALRWRGVLVAGCLIGAVAVGPVVWSAHRTLSSQRRTLCHSPTVKRALCGWPG